MDGCELSGTFEDELSSRGCWYNGLRGPGQSCDLASYMTCIDFQKLDAALKELKDTHTQEQWNQGIAFWETTSYLSPSIHLLALSMRRWYKQNFKEAA